MMKFLMALYILVLFLLPPFLFKAPRNLPKGTQILLSLYGPETPSTPALRTTGMWPYGRCECEQVFFIAYSLTYVGSLLSLRWTAKGNCAIGTVEKGTTFLRFKITPKTSNCFNKTTTKSLTIQIPKWAQLTHTVRKSPVFSAFRMAARAPPQAACSSSSCYRGTWMVSSCSSQLSSPLVIAEAALHLWRFILINKVLWPIRRGLYKVHGSFLDVTWQHSQ